MIMHQIISRRDAAVSKDFHLMKIDDTETGPGEICHSTELKASDQSSGLGSSRSGSERRWEIMFKGLVDYKEKHKTLKVSRGATCNGHSLYEWIRNNRKHYLNRLKGKTPALSFKRFDSLRSIGFDFDPTGVLGSNDAYDDKRWVAMFEGLSAYKERYGNFSVPVGYTCDGRSLLDWLRHQRCQHANALNGLRPALSKERTERLLSIGFDLDPTGQRRDARTEDERWNVMLKGLQDFYKRNGTFALPEGCLHDGRSLFSWARNQRRLFANYEKGIKPAISHARAERLRKIGFLQEKISVATPTRKEYTIKIKVAKPNRPVILKRRLTTRSKPLGRQSTPNGQSNSKMESVVPWALTIAMKSLSRYQNMSPKERRMITA